MAEEIDLLASNGYVDIFIRGRYECVYIRNTPCDDDDTLAEYPLLDLIARLYSSQYAVFSEDGRVFYLTNWPNSLHCYLYIFKLDDDSAGDAQSWLACQQAAHRYLLPFQEDTGSIHYRPLWRAGQLQLLRTVLYRTWRYNVRIRDPEDEENGLALVPERLSLAPGIAAQCVTYSVHDLIDHGRYYYVRASGTETCLFVHNLLNGTHKRYVLDLSTVPPFSHPMCKIEPSRDGCRIYVWFRGANNRTSIRVSDWLSLEERAAGSAWQVLRNEQQRSLLDDPNCDVHRFYKLISKPREVEQKRQLSAVQMCRPGPVAFGTGSTGATADILFSEHHYDHTIQKIATLTNTSDRRIGWYAEVICQKEGLSVEPKDGLLNVGESVQLTITHEPFIYSYYSLLDDAIVIEWANAPEDEEEPFDWDLMKSDEGMVCRRRLDVQYRVPRD